METLLKDRRKLVWCTSLFSSPRKSLLASFPWSLGWKSIGSRERGRLNKRGGRIVEALEEYRELSLVPLVTAELCSEEIGNRYEVGRSRSNEIFCYRVLLG